MSSLRIVWHQQAPIWEQPEQNLAQLELAAPPDETCDVWILPEMFASGFSMNPAVAESGEMALTWMKHLAKSRGYVVAGSLAFLIGNKAVNRFFWVEPQGKIVFYDKRNLFSFAKEDAHYSPGNERVMVRYKGWNIGLFVCYDLRFGVWMYRRPKFNYDLALVVANWPERRSRAWKTLLAARAIENQSYILGVNRSGKDGQGVLYSGDSQLMGPLGEIITSHQPFAVGNKSAELNLKHLISVRERFPFWTGGIDDCVV